MTFEHCTRLTFASLDRDSNTLAHNLATLGVVQGDRVKDRIQRRGENISCYEVEQVLVDHPDIEERAVVGIRVDGAGGEDEMKSVIVTKRYNAINHIHILDYCAQLIPRFAVPRFIEAVTEIPKSATGKIQKEPLREAGITNRTWDREAAGYKVPRRL